ncbi:uncharacterized protein EI90DRAFT_3034294 [Cantharellus anzutake]|uniref:uncharacterized protein n=1 Tax=Cantharellus anzutake TaxID=1750568 RepID=UPI001902EBDF|nr:uncharacterized protein EI90DRAFT_3034294 [Cantharellus anzutake]KAF8341543.1 hypothetical protein EI90DRAFT_3034294 [Cantharellus anzutake]
MLTPTEKFQRNFVAMLHPISPQFSALHQVRVRRENPSLPPSTHACLRCGTLLTPTHGTFRSRRVKSKVLKSRSRKPPQPDIQTAMVQTCEACLWTTRLRSGRAKGTSPSFPSVYRMSKGRTAVVSRLVGAVPAGESAQVEEAQSVTAQSHEKPSHSRVTPVHHPQSVQSIEKRKPNKNDEYLQRMLAHEQIKGTANRSRVHPQTTNRLDRDARLKQQKDREQNMSGLAMFLKQL